MSRTYYVGFKHIHLISQNLGKNFKKISGAFLFSLSVYELCDWKKKTMRAGVHGHTYMYMTGHNNIIITTAAVYMYMYMYACVFIMH